MTQSQRRGKQLASVRYLIDAADAGMRCVLVVSSESHAANVEQRFGLNWWPNIDIVVPTGLAGRTATSIFKDDLP